MCEDGPAAEGSGFFLCDRDVGDFCSVYVDGRSFDMGGRPWKAIVRLTVGSGFPDNRAIDIATNLDPDEAEALAEELEYQAERARRETAKRTGETPMPDRGERHSIGVDDAYGSATIESTQRGALATELYRDGDGWHVAVDVGAGEINAVAVLDERALRQLHSQLGNYLGRIDSAGGAAAEVNPGP